MVVLFVVLVALGLSLASGYVVKSAGGPHDTVTTQSGGGAEPVDSFDGSGHGLVP
jgi:hypothetical protein